MKVACRHIFFKQFQKNEIVKENRTGYKEIQAKKKCGFKVENLHKAKQQVLN